MQGKPIIPQPAPEGRGCTGLGKREAMTKYAQAARLRAVAKGEIVGLDAAEILRAACVEHGEAQVALFEYGRLLSQAEARLLYGEAGRPAQQSYR
jgi:hypothetical protein